MSALEELILAARSGDREASEKLITENTGLIWAVVKRFFGRGAEPDDLYQLGCVGFLKAIEGFDPQYGTQFSTYAVPKISGEIRRFLRDDGAIKVSRGMKERSAAIKMCRNQLLSALGREPTVLELSRHTGLSPEEIAMAETATATTESIHAEAGEDGFTLENILSDTESEESMVERLALQQAIEGLPERERTVIRLRYFHSLTQERVAKVMKVSQVQISRIEKKALKLLRERLE